MSKSKVRSSASKSATRKSSRASGDTLICSPRSDAKKASNLRSAPETNGALNSIHAIAPSSIQPLTRATPDGIAEKVRELVRLAQEQGYLTYNDINEALLQTL